MNVVANKRVEHGVVESVELVVVHGKDLGEVVGGADGGVGKGVPGGVVEGQGEDLLGPAGARLVRLDLTDVIQRRLGVLNSVCKHKLMR